MISWYWPITDISILAYMFPRRVAIQQSVTIRHTRNSPRAQNGTVKLCWNKSFHRGSFRFTTVITDWSHNEEEASCVEERQEVSDTAANQVNFQNKTPCADHFVLLNHIQRATLHGCMLVSRVFFTPEPRSKNKDGEEDDAMIKFLYQTVTCEYRYTPSVLWDALILKLFVKARRSAWTRDLKRCNYAVRPAEGSLLFNN